MNKIISITIVVAAILLLASQASAAPTWDKDPAAFEHGIALDINGENWYFAGVGSIAPPDNVTDIQGHTWVQTGPYQVVGRHYNVGPYNVSDPYIPWWAPGEPYGVLLYKVDGIIALKDLNDEKYEAHLKKKGYVHFHELVNATGDEHPTMVVYLKHTAVRDFFFKPMPMPVLLGHYVTPGIDFDFMPNW